LTDPPGGRGGPRDRRVSLAGFARQLRAVHPWLLVALLAIDAFLIGLHIFGGLRVLAGSAERIPPLWHLGSEFGLPEIFNYLKWTALVLVLGVAAYRRSSRLLVVIMLLFLVILLDDSLQIHERVGEALTARLGPLPETKAVRAAGGTAFWLLLVVVFVPLIAFAMSAAGRAEVRLAAPMALLFGGLVICGVAFDFVHYLHPHGIVGAALGVAEDGGEMIFASALLAYAAGAFLVDRPA
jgi:hypothetical protein